ncbi:MAG: lipid-A-disaccharide synthase [Chloroherpetonaceae bacterium]|nr:lipid-A-disaccharide synthase [Chloroherpetonaceae bacterium]MDW8437585.1 lipid-A-disaccharide synthase [Chloroherpetonaceae bacterium]
MPKKLFVLAGEASGDLHGAGVLRALKRLEPAIEIFGVGGKHIQAEGARLLYSAEQINFMGFAEVARHYFFLRRVLESLKRAIRREKPNAALLIDYPGMNLILAKFLKAQGVPVVYYIAPQVWAWKDGRVKTMRETISKLCVVFEFEVDYFKRRGMEAKFVGHPILEELADLSLPPKSAFLDARRLPAHRRLIGLLPGSRRQELERIFPEMLAASARLAKSFELEFLLGVAPTIPESFYEKFLSRSSVQPIRVSAYETMRYGDLAFVTSGTATLESLCFGLPMIVCYKTSPLNYFIGKRLVKIQKIALANIVADGLCGAEKTVPELLQNELTAENLARQAARFLEDENYRQSVSEKLLKAKEKLGRLNPSEEVAKEIAQRL